MCTPDVPELVDKLARLDHLSAKIDMRREEVVRALHSAGVEHPYLADATSLGDAELTEIIDRGRGRG